LIAAWNLALWADPIDASTWRSRYLADPNFRRETCPVAVEDSEVVGFLLGFLPPHGVRTASIVGFGVVPEARRHGVATALFRTFEATCRDSGCEAMLVGPYVPSYIAPGIDVDAYPEAIAFCDASAITEVARPLSMKASLTARSFTVPTEPTGGIDVRTAGPSDVLPCLEFVRAAFPEWSDDVTGVVREREGPLHRQASLQVAMAGEHCVGFAMSRAERFGPFGVEPAVRGRGVGGRLLEATLATMRRQGFHTAWFLWTSDQAARLYERHGFQKVRRFSLRRKVLVT
jgi:GNAT superfamily N-acetyltransferase